MHILIIAALEEEMPTIAMQGASYETLITRVGKVQASVSLAKRLAKQEAPHIDAILNVGTAGAKPNDGLSMGDLVACNTFIDRDMLQLAQYGTTYKTTTDGKGIKLFDNLMARCRVGICNTGDTFVTNGHFDGDVCDMEAFALAQMANAFDIPFLAVKFVSDIVGNNSVESWEAMLAHARKKLGDSLSDNCNHEL